MSTILLAWELGGGLGHLAQLAPLARALAARGHRVFAALRFLDRAQAVFGPCVATFLAAPCAQTPLARQIKPPVSFAQILHNMGWHDAACLGGLCAAWRGLYSLARPDVVVFDHAPTALLAARGERFAKLVIGSGFCVPPDEPDASVGGRNLRPWIEAPHTTPEARAAFEAEIVRRANEVSAGWGGEPLDRLTQLYRDVDETFLVTLPELDHYGPRAAARYWGPVTGTGNRAASSTPATDSNSPSSVKRIFAYLKDFPALPDLLAAIDAGAHEALVVCDGVPPEVRERFASDRLRFIDTPLDLARAAGGFDLAILNAGHGATAAMLLAGVPALLVPIHLEQGMLARAAARSTGACVIGSDKDGAQLVAKLNEMLEPANLARYTDAAHRFAAKHASFDPAAQVQRMVERVEGLMQPHRSARAAMFAG